MCINCSFFTLTFTKTKLQYILCMLQSDSSCCNWSKHASFHN